MSNETQDKKGMTKEFGLSSLSLRNSTSVLILTFLIICGGILAYSTMPKELFPEVYIYIYVPVPILARGIGAGGTHGALIFFRPRRRRRRAPSLEIPNAAWLSLVGDISQGAPWGAPGAFFLCAVGRAEPGAEPRAVPGAEPAAEPKAEPGAEPWT